MLSRRKFLINTAGALVASPLLKASSIKKSNVEISLAEWSLHRSIEAAKIDHLDFATVAKRDFGINAVEYVNGLFGSKKTNFKEAGKSSRYLARC
jgi:hypothetical protein